MTELLTNSGDPDLTRHFVLLGFSRLKGFKYSISYVKISDHKLKVYLNPLYSGDP